MKVKVVVIESNNSRATHCKLEKFTNKQSNSVIEIDEDLFIKYEEAFNNWVNIQREIRKLVKE